MAAGAAEDLDLHLPNLAGRAGAVKVIVDTDTMMCYVIATPSEQRAEGASASNEHQPAMPAMHRAAVSTDSGSGLLQSCERSPSSEIGTGMEDKTISLTPEGRARLEAELKHLREEHRPQVVQRLHTAREDSEAWDNPEIIEAKNDLSFVDGRIQEIERTLAKAAPIPALKTPGLVTLGSRVTLHNEETGEDEVYTIVGSAEAQPREGKISDRSPVGRAVLGHREQDKVQVETPAGPLDLLIARVE